MPRALLSAALLSAALGAKHVEFDLPAGTRRVVIDVGTSTRSDFEHDSVADPSLSVIGLEATPEAARTMRARLKQELRVFERWTVLERACSGPAEADELTFFVHPMQACNSLLSQRDGLNLHGGKCVGEKPTETRVRTTTLEHVLRKVPMRIEVLKVDIQGHEWPCIEGGGSQLQKVDNIFVEVQDVPSSELMYVGSGAAHVGDMDAKLAPLGFYRQYCEVNTPGVRELNCLYTQKGRNPLWVTGRPQHCTNLLSKRPQRCVSVVNSTMPPTFDEGFGTVQYVERLVTASEPGALDGRLREAGLFRNALGRHVGRGTRSEGKRRVV